MEGVGIVSARGEGTMPAAELRTVTEYLGISQVELARILGVNDRTVRSWLNGRDPIPEGIQATVAGWIDVASGVVSDLVMERKGESGDGVALVVYRSDQDFWDAKPQLRPWPARWWRMVVARAADQLGRPTIRYPDESP